MKFSKFSYVALIFVFLFGQLQITFATDRTETIPASQQAEDVCCMSSNTSHHDMHSAHDCCQQDSASDMNCLSCGDGCHCGSTCHFSMHFFDFSSLVDYSFQPVISSLAQPGTSIMVSAVLTHEIRPPRFS